MEGKERKKEKTAFLTLMLDNFGLNGQNVKVFVSKKISWALAV